MSELSDYFIDHYRKARGASYIGFCARDGAILANLKKTLPGGERELRWHIREFLKIEDDPAVRRSGWDIRMLQARSKFLHIGYARKFGEAEVAKAKETRERIAEVVKNDPKVLSLLDRIGGGKG